MPRTFSNLNPVRSDRLVGGLSLWGAGALMFLAGACSSAQTYEDQDPFRRAVREGRLDDAAEMATQALEEDPGSEEALQRTRDVEIMKRIERARELTFDDQPQAALDMLLSAQALDPENPTVQVWIAKTRRQLASAWLDIASSFSGDADLAKAEEALRRALLYVPGDPDAKKDLERTLIRSEYRKDLSEDYFYQGLSALREARLISADRDLGISTLYDEANEDAARRRESVRIRLAEERLASAYDLEEQGLFFAAYSEFRAVLFHDPDRQEAIEGVERLAREVKAELHIRSAEMMILRQEFEAARAELALAREQTVALIGRVEQLEGEIEGARWEALYDRGLALYEDQRYAEAVAVLTELLEEEESYADARELRDTLVDTIADVEALYARALAAEDDATQLDLLRQVQVMWVEYKDVPQRIAALREKLATEGS